MLSLPRKTMKTGKRLRSGGWYPPVFFNLIACTKLIALTWIVFTLITALLVSCARPPQESAGDGAKAAQSPEAKAAGSPKASSKTGVLPSTTPEPTEWSLATVAVNILDKAHHTGSVVERCQCGPGNRLVLLYSFHTSDSFHAAVKVEPMAEAFNEISKRYPDIQWREVGEGHVRVTDNSARAGLLKVRVKEFLVIEDRPPQAALSALWKTDEVAAYMARHNVHFARTRSASFAAGAKRAPAIIHVKNATVQEIMDRILDSYRAPAGSGLHKVWIYRECQRGAETFVEVRVL